MSRQLDLFEPAPGLVGARHPDTSRDAPALVMPRTGTLRRAVLDYVTARGDDGATDLEIQTALRMPGNTERPRRLELVSAGLLEDSGDRRHARGRAFIVWRAT